MRARLHRRAGRAMLVGVTLALILLVAAPTAVMARKVGNPGPFRATVPDGLIRVKSTSFGLADIDPNPTLDGTIAGNGSFTIPIGGINFPPVTFETTSGTFTARILPTHDWTGNLDPLSGAATMRARFRVKLEGPNLGGSCYLGNSGNPIDLNPTTTGRTNPPGPNQPIEGRPYNSSNGTARLVNNSASVPGAEGCSTAGGFISTNGQVNEALGTPSPSGNNEAQFELNFNPILDKGVRPSFTRTPASGAAPHSVTFDAAGSFVPAGARAGDGYRWDFDGNGTTDRTTTTAQTTFAYPTPGTFIPRLQIVDSEGDSNTASGPAVTVLPPPDLSLSKSDGGASFRVGTQGSYALTVANVSAFGSTEGPITVTDNLPEGLTFVSASGPSFTCMGAIGGRSFTCTRSEATPLGPGATATINLQVLVGPGAAPVITNTATVATAKDSNAANNTASDTTTVTRVDLALDKSNRGGFRVGGRGTYDLGVQNLGTAPTAGAATVSDTLPPGLTFVSGSGDGWICSAAGQQVTCQHPDPIAPNSSAPLSLEVAIGRAAAPSVTNTAVASTADDVDAANNTDSDTTAVAQDPDLSVDKSHTGDFRVGGQGEYSITVTNVGAVESTGVTTVTDTLPAGLTPVSATGTGSTCSISGQVVTCTNPLPIPVDGSLPPITITVDVGGAAAPAVTNTASVSTSGATDPFSANDSDSDPTRVTEIDLTIEKDDGGGFRTRRNETYRLTVSNPGTAATVGTTTVLDSIPVELAIRSAGGPGWSCSVTGQDVSCSRTDSIAAGATAPVISIVVGVPSAGSNELTNSASVSTEDDVRASNDSDTVTTPVSSVDLRLRKSHSSDFRVGDTRAYTLLVENIGSAPTSGQITVTDQLPLGMTYVAAGSGGFNWECATSGQDVTCTYSGGPLDEDEAASRLTIRVAVGGAALPDKVNIAMVSTPNDRITANDSSSDRTVVVAPDVTVDKAHEGDFRAGAQGTYTLTARNVGTAPTDDATVITDTLPTGLRYLDATGPGWDCGESAGTVTCRYTEAIPEESSAPAVTLRVDVGEAASPELTNTATISGADDTNAANDADSDTTTIRRIDLGLAKESRGAFEAGSNAFYELSVSNGGTAATVGSTRVTDTLPAGVSFVDAVGPGWECEADGQTVSCLREASVAPGSGAPTITIEVDLDPSLSGPLTNSASVATRGDVAAANDTEEDTTDVAGGPNVAVTLDSDDDPLRVGTDATYLFSVRSAGPVPTQGQTDAVLTLPDGLTFVAVDAPPGWTCTSQQQQVSCSNPSPLPSDSRSDISVEASVSSAAAAEVTASVAVSTPSDAVASDNSDSRTSDVSRIDVALTKSHAGNFRVGETGLYSLQVENVGTAGTVGPMVVTDRLPPSLFPLSATGAGYDCRIAGQTVRCVRDAVLEPGAKAEPIELRVDVSAEAAPEVRNVATVSTPDDVGAANDSATDDASVGPPAAQRSAGDAAERPTPSDGPPPAAEERGTPVGASGAATTTTTPSRLRSSSKFLRSRRGTTSVALTCEVGPCVGVLRLVRVGPRAANTGAATALGSAAFALAEGRSATIRVKLSKSARALLRRARRVDVRLVVETGGRSVPLGGTLRVR